MNEDQKNTIDEVIQTLASYRLQKRSEKNDPVGVTLITKLIERVKLNFPMDE